MAQQPKRATKSASDHPEPAEVQETVEVARSLETRPLLVADQLVADEEVAGASWEMPADDATLLRPSVKAKKPGDGLQDAGVAPATAAPSADVPADGLADELADEIADEVDPWSLADQPTAYLPPRQTRRTRPKYLDTGEQPSWPPRPAAASASPRPPAPPDSRARAEGRTRPQLKRPGAPMRDPDRVPAIPPRPAGANPYGQTRLAAPDGRRALGTPPAGTSRAALPDPRMQRFQELRDRRLAFEAQQRGPTDARPVVEMVRQWWNDLLPGLQRSLHYQREAQASGVHPIPAHEASPLTRLGDAFGRLAASARDLTDRAQAAVTPALKRLHGQAEQGAQAIVGKIEGPIARQQAPLLGPGRIAVFFRQGVSVAQAQNLLADHHAIPIRLIPRKHGFLARVKPGTEAEVAELLREHEYIRDVAHLEFDTYGQPIGPR